MKLFQRLALALCAAAGLLFVGALPVQNSITVVSNLTALQGTPIAAAYSGVIMRTTDGTASAPPMPFLSGEGTCSSAGLTNDGASCVNSSDGNHWLGVFANNVYDVREWSPACYENSTDSTTQLQAVATYATTHPGIISVTCGLHIAGTVNLSSTSATNGTRLTGEFQYFPGQTNDTSTTSVWPPANGPYIDCGNASGTNCLQVAGQAVEIDHLPLGNTQPTPGGSFTPNSYGFILGTVAADSWSGLYVHDDSFTSSDNCVDLEGNTDYTVNPIISGGQFRLAHLWMNPCFNTGIKAHNLDNTGNFEDIHYDFWWNHGTASVGQYVKQNSIGIDACYISNTMMNGIEFFANKEGVQWTNCSVKYSNTLTKTFAGNNVQMLNIDFNDTCTGFTIPNGNGTAISGMMSNVIAQADTTGQCNSQTTAPGSVFFDLSSDDVNFTISHLLAQNLQTVASIGFGNAGWLRMIDPVVQDYSAIGTGAAAFLVSANSHFSGITDPSLIVPAAGAGNLLGAGLDNSQGYMTPACVGGGQNPKEGSACLQGSLGGASTGSLTLYDTGSTQQGYVGAGNSSGININATHGGVFINSASGVASQFTGGGVVLPTSTVSGLPACNSAHNGWEYLVTDQSTTPSYLGSLTGSGGGRVLAVCNNGAGWQAH